MKAYLGRMSSGQLLEYLDCRGSFSGSYGDVGRLTLGNSYFLSETPKQI